MFGREEHKQFRVFYTQWSPQVFTFLQLYTGDQARAEQAAEEAFMHYFRQGHELEPRYLPLPLLRYARDAADRNAPRRLAETPAADELEDVLALLPADLRAVFILRSVLELDRQQVAFAAGLTTDRAEQLWSEALIHLRELWRPTP